MQTILFLTKEQPFYASDQSLDLPIWLPILIFLVLIFGLLWLIYSLQEELPEYSPPGTILSYDETPHIESTVSGSEADSHAEHPSQVKTTSV